MPIEEFLKPLGQCRPPPFLFVTPFIMDVRVWTNAKETIGRNLVAALGGHHVDRLHVLTSSADARFELEIVC